MSERNFIMANTVEYAKVFQNELDKQICEGATSGWMEDNAGQVIYNGGKEIKLPKMSLQGLGNYDRDEGYTEGAVTFSYQTMTMSQDRGRRFRIDAMDVDETAFGLTAANVASEFQRTRVIPEIDAYRYSTLAAKAEIKENYVPEKATVLSQLLAQLSKVYDVTGGESSIVITMARPVYDMLMSSEEVSRYIDAGSFKQGELDLAVKTINGAAVIPVSSARMKSAYSFKTGSGSEADGGFAASESAVDVNWIICPKNAPVAVSKTDNVKMISPDINQFADAWDIDYRKYHDLFVSDNAKKAIAVSLNQAG